MNKELKIGHVYTWSDIIVQVSHFDTTKDLVYFTGWINLYTKTFQKGGELFIRDKNFMEATSEETKLFTNSYLAGTYIEIVEIPELNEILEKLKL
jgi:hypothetical protein